MNPLTLDPMENVTLGGTEAFGVLDVRFTEKLATGAGPFNCTVPTANTPPTTEDGVIETVATSIGLMVRDAVADVLFVVAVTTVVPVVAKGVV